MALLGKEFLTDLDKWISKCGFQTSSSSITWKLVRHKHY